MTPDEELEQALADPGQTYDMSASEPQEHKFEHIVGNQLQCVLHENCVGMFIKPWQVLERNDKGELELVDKLPV